MTWLEKNLGYCFSDKSLLNAALIHTSSGGVSFQRLEFLGDRVLGCVIAEVLYEKYPSENEGQLAKRLAGAVQARTLHQLAGTLKLQKFLRFDGPPSYSHNVLADTCEAILGAIYLDGGFLQAKKVITHLWEPLLDAQELPPIDPKSELQEYLQADKKSLPVYEVLSQQGPSHSPLFRIRLIMEEGHIFYADGSSKKEAEQKVAAKALAFLKNNFKLPI